MMAKRPTVLPAIASAALLAAVLIGCSGEKPSGPTTSTSAAAGEQLPQVQIETSATPVPVMPTSIAQTSTTPPPAPGEGEGKAIVTIDGDRKEYSGTVTCTNTEDVNTNIVLSKPTATYSISISVSQDGTKVRSVGLGNLDGVSLSFQSYQNGLHASFTRDGNTYTIRGTAVGYNKDELGKLFTKEFEVTVSCP